MQVQQQPDSSRLGLSSFWNPGVDETEFSKISLEEIVEEPMAMVLPSPGRRFFAMGD